MFFRQVFVESSDSTDHQVPFTDSHLWKLLDRHGNTIRLLVLLPEQSPGTLANRTLCQKIGGDSDAAVDGSKANRKSVEAILEESTEKLKNLSLQQQQQQSSSSSDDQKSSDAAVDGSKANRNSVETILEERTEKLKNLSMQQQQQQQQQGSSTSDGQKSSDVAVDGSKANRNSVEAILEESTEKLKNLSMQQQQGSSTSDSQKSSDASDFEHIESPSQEADSNSSLCVAADNRELENRIRATVGSSGGASSDPNNHFACEERSDSEVNNDRSTSSVDSDILSSSHSSDTLCNADSGPIQLANGLDSHSITSSRRSKAHEGKKETWDTAEEDSGTDSEYDENGKNKAEAAYLYFRTEPCTQDDSTWEAQKCMKLVIMIQCITLKKKCFLITFHLYPCRWNDRTHFFIEQTH